LGCINARKGVVILNQYIGTAIKYLYILAAVSRISRIQEKVSDNRDVRLVLSLYICFPVGDHISLYSKIVCAVSKYSVRNIAATRKGAFRVNVVVKDVDGVPVVYDNSVAAARSNFRLADGNSGGVRDGYTIPV
jgi:hypothetical protein